MRFERGQEAHPEVREGLGVPPGGPGEVEKPTCRSGSPTWRSERGREAHPAVQ